MIRCVRFLSHGLVSLAIVGVFAAPSLATDTDRDALGNEAIELMIENSGAGQAEALLGVLYLRGMRLEPDPVAAMAWLERAARAGHPAGLYAAARMLAEGIGVAVDTERARNLLKDHDPARFGPLAGAVRQLRLSLDLPEASPPPPPPPTVPAPTPEPAPEPKAEASAAPAPADKPGPEATLAKPPAAEAQPSETADTVEPQPKVFAQLATLLTEASTIGEIARIRSLLAPEQVSGHELVVRPTKLSDGRAAWRVLAVGFATLEEARAFCAVARTTGLGCIPKG